MNCLLMPFTFLYTQIFLFLLQICKNFPFIPHCLTYILQFVTCSLILLPFYYRGTEIFILAHRISFLFLCNFYLLFYFSKGLPEPKIFVHIFWQFFYSFICIQFLHPFKIISVQTELSTIFCIIVYIENDYFPGALG